VAFGMGLSVVFVITLANAITHPFYNYILVPLGLAYLQTITFILTIASVVQLVEMFLKKSFPTLYSALGIFLPLIAVNCAILGAALINIEKDLTFIEAIFNSVGAGAGYMLAIILLAGIRERFDTNPNIPEFFKGFPLALFSTALMSIALMGFQGLVK
jgi:electron transport complex protein RnfA